ncbi:MAG TPA: PAS domain-containing protein, partial [Mycobacteriales bacterium]|nr:PAS domain-containing protein [Mycobacteriales bacterium]
MGDLHDRSELSYRRIIETANEGVWVLDPAGRTTYANAKIAALLGYSAEEMASLSLYDVLDEPGKDRAAANLELRREGQSAQLECSYLRKDGTPVWVLLNASPLFDEAGGYLGSVSLVSE